MNMSPIIKSCKTILQKSDKMKSVLKMKRIINSKRQPKNLKQILSSSKCDMKVEAPSVNNVTKNDVKPIFNRRTDNLFFKWLTIYSQTKYEQCN